VHFGLSILLPLFPYNPPLRLPGESHHFFFFCPSPPLGLPAGGRRRPTTRPLLLFPFLSHTSGRFRRRRRKIKEKATEASLPFFFSGLFPFLFQDHILGCGSEDRTEWGAPFPPFSPSPPPLSLFRGKKLLKMIAAQISPFSPFLSFFSQVLPLPLAEKREREVGGLASASPLPFFFFPLFALWLTLRRARES